MSEPSSTLAVAPPVDRRLHPWSWLFVLLQQLRQFVLPLAVLLFAGRRSNTEEWWELAPLFGVGVLVLVSALQYFTYRYRLGRDGITIRSGLLQRSQREIPFARIHNVGLHQTLLHRIFQVAEVRLESAGGEKPEAHMRVLGMDDALALERLVRHRGADAGAASAAATEAGAADHSHTLLTLPVREVLRLGLVSNRGMIVVAAGFGLVWQMFPDERLVARYAQDSLHEAASYAGNLQLGWIGIAGAALAAMGVFVFVLRLLSVALALSQYHGFRLSEAQRRLTADCTEENLTLALDAEGRVDAALASLPEGERRDY